MAIIISNENDMVSLINMAVSEAQTYDHEMAVVPMVIADTPEKASTLLLDVKTFDPRVAADVLPKDAIGKVRIGKTRTVHDALDELESLTMIGCHELDMAVRSMASQHVKGKTRKVKIKMMGEWIVDLQKFAQLSGLPTDSPGLLEYSVFLREVTDKKHDGNKTMLVLVKGTTDISGGNGGNPTALQSMMARLEARANTGFEPGASFHARDLDNVWQLYNNAQFVDLLGWWKRGYYYTVVSDENQGLKISY